MKSKYKIYCTDCIEGAQKHLSDNSIDLIITDPPYGISGDLLHKHYHRKESNVISGYVEIKQSDYFDFSVQWIKEAERVLRPGGSIYILSGYSNLVDILNALRQTNLEEINHLIWKYNFGVYTSKKYVSSHYHILYYEKPGGKRTFNTFSRIDSDEKNSTGGSLNYLDREDVWIINREYKPGKIKNKNELPLELLIKLIQYSSNENEVVCDFFLGGFSTAKAAIGLNRKMTGFEINKNSFNHHYPELKKIMPGYLLNSIKTGKNNQPKNQGKPWDSREIVKLGERFKELYSVHKNKKKSIEILQKEFSRGYFSILNKIDEFQKR
ncbi:MAG: site-specific DNA-methyltransferase [Calditrichia bacterium]|nr:site-specific DNA-methyltransferase [Calditrichia bacterium]